MTFPHCTTAVSAGPTLWNSLPLTVCDPSLTQTQFCALLKTTLFCGAHQTLPQHLRNGLGCNDCCTNTDVECADNQSLTKDDKRPLVQEFIHCRLDYCNALLSGTADIVGARKHGQGGHLPRPRKVVKCFGAFVIPVIRSLNELFMHYFQNICRLLGRFWGLCPRLHRGSVYGPGWGTEALDPLICPPWKKNPADAHAWLTFGLNGGNRLLSIGSAMPGPYAVSTDF